MARGRTRDVHEADDGVVAGRGLGDHHAAVGVADEHDGPADRRDHVAHVGGVAGDAAQGVGDGDDVEDSAWLATSTGRGGGAAR